MSKQDFTDCPYWGQGGRYVVDPATGARIPVNDDPEPAQEPLEPSGAAEATDKPVKKGK